MKVLLIVAVVFVVVISANPMVMNTTFVHLEESTWLGMGFKTKLMCREALSNQNDKQSEMMVFDLCEFEFPHLQFGCSEGMCEIYRGHGIVTSAGALERESVLDRINKFAHDLERSYIHARGFTVFQLKAPYELMQQQRDLRILGGACCFCSHCCACTSMCCAWWDGPCCKGHCCKGTSLIT